jgi:hypothetical protein
MFHTSRCTEEIGMGEWETTGVVTTALNKLYVQPFLSSNFHVQQGMSELLAVTVYLLYIEQWPEEIPLTPDVRSVFRHCLPMSKIPTP